MYSSVDADWSPRKSRKNCRTSRAGSAPLEETPATASTVWFCSVIGAFLFSS